MRIRDTSLNQALSRESAKPDTPQGKTRPTVMIHLAPATDRTDINATVEPAGRTVLDHHARRATAAPGMPGVAR
jgi:hypothetical protein